MTNKITMLNISQLEHHPDNPRKNIGDITELTASIQKDGILQNLTVVPHPVYQESYYVVIGNRRLEAAKAAGLTELPCAISDMDKTKQLETMLIENINRSDLTPIEEAEGFKQLTLAGFTAEDIAEKTGFSVSTVNRRLKIAEYNNKKANEALGRGATLADFAKLEELTSKKDREEMLQYIGTNNFSQQFNARKNLQIISKNKKEIRKLLKGKATELECPDSWSTPNGYEQDNNGSVWIADEKLNTSMITQLKGDYEHFYYFTASRIYFCKKKEKASSSNSEKPKHTDAQKQYERNRRKLNNMAVDFYQLRKEFIESLKNKKSLPGWKDICLEFIALYAINNYNFDIGTDYYFNKNAGIIGAKAQRDIKRKEYIEAHKAGFIINQLYKGFVDSSSYTWHYSQQYEQPKFIGCDSLDMLYEFLCKLGYQMCDDELKCQNGTHELMQKE